MPLDNPDRKLPEGHHRLLVLAEFLETKVPRPRFNLEDWGCGTTACAVGWAASIPEFKIAGLRMARDKDDKGRLFPICRDGLHELDGWDAVEVFFGLEFGEAQHLFSIFDYDTVMAPGPHDVAGRIRAFVASKQVAERATEEQGLA